MSESTDKFDAYQLVTDRILAAIDAGVAPWRKGWATDLGRMRSLSTGKAYRGANPFLLAISAAFDIVDHPTMKGRKVLKPKADPFTSPWWGAFNQIKERGGMVRKGERGTYVTFWKSYEKRETITDPDSGAELENVRERFALRYYCVFNVDQCEGDLKLPKLPEVPPGADKVGRAEQIIGAYLASDGPKLEFRGAQPAYDPAADRVIMPASETFYGTDEFYAAMFHELSHSTGHKSRLARDVANAFGCEAYAKEELVAELGAAFLCSASGIEPDIENSAAYLAGWRKAISEDKHLFVSAAAQGQRAAEWVQGTRYERAVKVAARRTEQLARSQRGAPVWRARHGKAKSATVRRSTLATMKAGSCGGPSQRLRALTSRCWSVGYRCRHGNMHSETGPRAPSAGNVASPALMSKRQQEQMQMPKTTIRGLKPEAAAKAENVEPHFVAYWRQDREDYQTTLCDILADLMHFADMHRLSFEQAITDATAHYEAER